MRGVVALAALTIASLSWSPQPLVLGVPQIAIEGSDCPASPPAAARAVAHALGFLHAHKSWCYRGDNFVTVSDASAPYVPLIRNLVAISAPPPRALESASMRTMFKIPAEVPWVSANGSILAYVKIDALLLRVSAENALETAFALENAGVSRDDMMVETPNSQLLFVRVQPVTVARVLKIGDVAQKQLEPRANYVYSETAFVRDCDGTIAALSGLALAQARAHAQVMARAAGTEIGEPLGVVDSGGRVVDAICGFGSDATVQQLVRAEQSSPGLQGSHGELHASIVRTISAAWRLKRPENSPGKPWYDYSWGSEIRQPFISDGQRGRGDALLSVVPDRAVVLVPEWAYAALERSSYATSLKRVSMELRPLQPAIVLRAKNLPQLTRLTADLQTYVSQVGSRIGKGDQALQAVYGLDDCTIATNTALFRATRNAISHLGGKPLRYLQQTWLQTLGDTNCTYEPESDDNWSSVSAPKPGGAGASVAIGY